MKLVKGRHIGESQVDYSKALDGPHQHPYRYSHDYRLSTVTQKIYGFRAQQLGRGPATPTLYKSLDFTGPLEGAYLTARGPRQEGHPAENEASPKLAIARASGARALPCARRQPGA